MTLTFSTPPVAKSVPDSNETRRWPLRSDTTFNVSDKINTAKRLEGILKDGLTGKYEFEYGSCCHYRITIVQGVSNDRLLEFILERCQDFDNQLCSARSILAAFQAAESAGLVTIQDNEVIIRPINAMNITPPQY